MKEIYYPATADLEIWMQALVETPESNTLKPYLPPVSRDWYEVVTKEIQLIAMDIYGSTLHRKGAYLFYKIIKNHNFVNSNKRSALIVLYIFYFINDYVLSMEPKAVYELAAKTADRKETNNDSIGSRLSEGLIEEIEHTLTEVAVKLQI